MRIEYFRTVLTATCLAWVTPSLALAQPVITTPPTSQAVVAGGSATFSVEVSGPGPFTYQWRLNGTNLPNIITTVAGNGTAGYSGDGGPATNATLNEPQGLVVDGLGNLFIGDFRNNRVRKVDTNGIITTVAGTGTAGFSGNGGAATNARLYSPHGVALDGSGNLLFGDLQNYRIRKVDTNGIITTVAGTGTAGYSGDGGAATNARVNWAQGVVVDELGNLLISDSMNYRIRKVGTNGIITSIAGKGTSGYTGDGGAATNATLEQAKGVALDRFGNLFFADGFNGRIRKVDTNGIITTVAGGGKSGPGSSFDGIKATNAYVSTLDGVAVDGFGNVFFSDNNRVRKVDTNGIITTVAGKNSFSGGYSGDGGVATNAALNLAGFLALDGFGNLFIGDLKNHRIRKVTFATGPTLVVNNVGAQNAGNYDLVVTSPFGSFTSRVAVLTVGQPFSLNATISSANNLILSFTGTAGQNYILQAATSLLAPINWQPVVTNAADPSGNWRFTNATVSAQPAVFYRVALP